jgi:glycosyltransferase involved in cell wall biosynthesis
MVGEPTKNEGNDYYQYLMDLIGRYSLADKIHLRPFSDTIEIYLRAFDIFVLTSVSETYGMVTVEAMVSGLPIVATNSGGTPELLQFGELGMLFSPGNKYDLFEKLSALLDDPEAAKMLGIKAQRHAINRFSHVTECREMERVILQLFDGRRAGEGRSGKNID